MTIRTLSLAVALAVLGAACSEDTKEQSPGEVLARDSSLASDLKQADTSAFAEAADVAMAFNPDSAMPAPTKPAVPMRVDRSAGTTPAASGTPATAATPTPAPTPTAVPPVERARMRPVPATIHPEPIPTRRLPATRDGGSSATTILEKVPGAALPPVSSAAPCASPSTPDQRRCLMMHLAQSDVALDRTYQALIAELKRKEGTPPGAKEPESVHQLRVAQRAWLVYRDTECRQRNRGKEGPLWAPVRAACLAEFSGAREEELAKLLRERTSG
jgi:uncharacterized protein YecT (DUF1311 family)